MNILYKICLILLICLLSGCGRTGSLYLPDQKPPPAEEVEHGLFQLSSW